MRKIVRETKKASKTSRSVSISEVIKRPTRELRSSEPVLTYRLSDSFADRSKFVDQLQTSNFTLEVTDDKNLINTTDTIEPTVRYTDSVSNLSKNTEHNDIDFQTENESF